MPYLKHCNKMPQKSNDACENRMYRLQVTWDKLLVFVGAMHLEQNLGIPLRFSRINNKPFLTISNKKIDKKDKLEIDTNKADFVYIYE